MRIHRKWGVCVKKKEAFWLDLDEAVKKIPKHERIIFGAVMNGQAGEGNNGDEECIGRLVERRRNDKDKQWWILPREWV